MSCSVSIQQNIYDYIRSCSDKHCRYFIIDLLLFHQMYIFVLNFISGHLMISYQHKQTKYL